MNCSSLSVSFSSSTLDSEGKPNRDRKASESNIRGRFGGKEKVKNELTEKGDEISVVPHYTTIELQDAQKANDNLTLILYFLENNVEPAQSELAISCSATKKYLLNRVFLPEWLSPL
jgi:hypothetical protein